MSSRVIPVFLYHSVADEPSGDRDFAVSRATFDAHAGAIKASGRVSLRISDLAAGLRGERPLPERAAAVTFDDGCADNYDAIQSLVRRGLCCTAYIITGEVGAPDRLDDSRLLELADLPGVELGAHTVSHRYLDELDAEELARETELSKVQLEEIVQRGVGSFAYPHGAYDSRARQAVIDAGYRSAVAVKNAVSHSAEDPFAIARWTVMWGTPASRIAQVLEGENVPRAWSRERARTRAYRMVRRGRRRLARVRSGER